MPEYFRVSLSARKLLLPSPLIQLCPRVFPAHLPGGDAPQLIGHDAEQPDKHLPGSACSGSDAIDRTGLCNQHVKSHGITIADYSPESLASPKISRRYKRSSNEMFKQTECTDILKSLAEYPLA